MTEDKLFEDLFSKYKPEMNSDDEFMAALSKKLAAVEFVKQYYEKEVRLYRRFVVVAAMCGVVIGMIFYHWLLSLPDNVPLFSFGIQTQLFVFIEQNSKYLMLVLFSIFMVVMYILIFNIYSHLSDTCRHKQFQSLIE
jgi:hypothetical protein